jgi:hypothetical protein
MWKKENSNNKNRHGQPFTTTITRQRPGKNGPKKKPPSLAGILTILLFMKSAITSIEKL